MVVPVLMLLALFVLWAGRGGRAGLIADLAAEEAATAAAMGCEHGEEAACEDLVGDVLSARPGLDFLCVGGVRAEAGSDGLVEEKWVRFDAVGDGGAAPEAAGVGLFGVGFVCETDGAVAPLRGMFPTVAFRGRGSEVAIEQGPPKVKVSDTVNFEGEDLVFELVLDSPAVRDVTLYYSVTGADGDTVGGVECVDLSGVDFVQPNPPSVVVSQGDTTATITVVTCEDVLREDDNEVVELVFDLDLVPPLDPDWPEGPRVIAFDDHRGDGKIVDDDGPPTLDVVARKVREGSGWPLEFEVEMGPGRA